jgi:hypothetical protein
MIHKEIDCWYGDECYRKKKEYITSLYTVKAETMMKENEGRY